jgi:maleate isomerase
MRARIGLIIPSSNRLTEPQMQRYAPAGVQVHVTRLRMTGSHHVPLPELLPRIQAATLALDDARCHTIVFHCTASSMQAGLAGEARVLEVMREVTAAAVATTAGATFAAMRALRINVIALFSPYMQATHVHEVEFLREAGVQVVGGRCLGLSGGDEYINVPASEWLRIARTETPAEADGVFLSCTNIQAPDVIEALEEALEKPVVTSNQAVLWYALRACGRDDAPAGLGRLLNLGLSRANEEYAVWK